MKCKLYASESGWAAKENALRTHLGIPNGGTTAYSKTWQVTDEESEHHGKWVMPVMTSGHWKCDDQFNANDLLDYEVTWNPDA